MMKKTWGKLFRRKSITETELREDYPTDNESFTFEDERRRDEVYGHLSRKETPSDFDELEDDAQDDWEYFSEYNVSFSSDDSIIDAFKENAGRTVHGDKEFEDVFVQAAREQRSCTGRERKENRRQLLGSAEPNLRPMSSPNPVKFREPPKSPSIRERAKMLEHSAAGGRRGSCLPPITEKGQANSEGRYATWNHANMKRKHRKHQKQRKRSRENDLSDMSDDESKYTVNLSLDELNNIIKKNISSAVKTIVTATSRGKKIHRVPSLTESLSTETETIFSGSSSHSTEIAPGMLHKQIKAQLDKDKLRGNRRHSLAVGLNHPANDTRRVSGNLHSNMLQPIPNIIEIPPSPYNSRHSDMQLSPYLNVMQPVNSNYQVSPQTSAQPVLPAPPPPPPPPPPPQVTFNLPAQGFQSTSPLSNLLNQDHISNPFNTNDEIPSEALSRLQTRRHTLASLGDDHLLTGLANNFETKLQQVNNAIRLLDNNINLSESLNSSQRSNTSSQPSNNALQSSQGSNNVQQQLPQSNNIQANTVTTETPEITMATNVATGPILPLPNVLAPVLSIADQIKALTKKKEKKLQPGQIRMSGCVRAVLILTNIVFLMSGCGLIGLGVWMMMDSNIETYFSILDVEQNSSDFKIICYALIGLGSFVTFIGFMGCCGGIKSNKCMLSVFIVTVAVITLAEAGLGAMVALNMDSPSAIPILSAIFENVEGNLMTLLKRSVVEKYAPETMFGTTWDNIQINLECCGASGPDDYKLSMWKNDTNNDLTIPDTCCVLLSKTAEVPEPSNKLLCQMGTTGFFHATGCYDTMVGWFKDNSTYILAGGISTLCIEVFSFIFALVICRKAHHDEQKYKDRPGVQ